MATDPVENELRGIIEDFVTGWQDCAVAPKDEMRQKWHHFCDDFGLDDTVVFLRPSGNPATPSMLLDMIISGDVTSKSMEVVSVDSIRVFAEGRAAVVTFTQHATFTYKGKPNDDIAKWSMVFEKGENTGNCWKIVHGHRGTGQPPAQPVAAGQ